jgi:hypothetical protein
MVLVETPAIINRGSKSWTLFHLAQGIYDVYVGLDANLSLNR